MQLFLSHRNTKEHCGSGMIWKHPNIKNIQMCVGETDDVGVATDMSMFLLDPATIHTQSSATALTLRIPYRHLAEPRSKS